MTVFYQDGSDTDQLIYADYLADNGYYDLADNLRLDIANQQTESEWCYEHRSDDVGGVGVGGIDSGVGGIGGIGGGVVGGIVVGGIGGVVGVVVGGVIGGVGGGVVGGVIGGVGGGGGVVGGIVVGIVVGGEDKD